MVDKSNPRGDLIFSLFRQICQRLIATCSLCDGGAETHSMANCRQSGKIAPFSWHVHDCSGQTDCSSVCLCHTLLFTQVVLVWVPVAGGFVICAALGLLAFAVLRSSCGSFLFLLPVLPEGAVIYGQRLTSFAEASNSCANRSIKLRTGRKRWEINKINILQTTHRAIVETQKQRHFCNG